MSGYFSKNLILTIPVETYLVSVLFRCGVGMTFASMIVLTGRTTILCWIKESQREEGLCESISLYKVTQLYEDILQCAAVGQQLLQHPALETITQWSHYE